MKEDKLFHLGQTLILGGCILTTSEILIFALQAGLLAIVIGFLLIYISWVKENKDREK